MNNGKWGSDGFGINDLNDDFHSRLLTLTDMKRKNAAEAYRILSLAESAPDLLAACEAACDFINNIMDDQNSEDPCVEIYCQLKEVIKRAKGE